MIDLDAAEKLANGFRGRFEFKPDDDAGYDRLEYLSADGEPYEIAERLDREVAEPLAEMLNMFGPLIAEVRRLRAKLADAHEQLDACCERCLDKCPHVPTRTP